MSVLPLVSLLLLLSVNIDSWVGLVLATEFDAAPRRVVAPGEVVSLVAQAAPKPLALDDIRTARDEGSGFPQDQYRARVGYRCIAPLSRVACLQRGGRGCGSEHRRWGFIRRPLLWRPLLGRLLVVGWAVHPFPTGFRLDSYRIVWPKVSRLNDVVFGAFRTANANFAGLVCLRSRGEVGFRVASHVDLTFRRSVVSRRGWTPE